MKLFITGTDTGVGKTYVTCLLLRALAARGETAAGFKPITCGSREDAEAIARASDPPLDADQVNPIALKAPASPMAAGLIENQSVDVGMIMTAFEQLEADHILIEGVGGWEVPIRADFSMADLAAEIAAPVLVVVNNRLGALNHTILTVNAIRSRGLECAGIILNHVEDERDSASISNRAILEEILDAPVVLDILHGESEIGWPF